MRAPIPSPGVQMPAAAAAAHTSAHTAATATPAPAFRITARLA
jgi:hypothetical protein